MSKGTDGGGTDATLLAQRVPGDSRRITPRVLAQRVSATEGFSVAHKGTEVLAWLSITHDTSVQPTILRDRSMDQTVEKFKF